MVHLTSVPTDKNVAAPLIEGVDSIKLNLDDQDSLTASVYGSSYAAKDLPKHEMPENEMPKEVAYRLIKYGSNQNKA